MSGRVEAGDRGRLADAARVEADDVVLLLQRCADGEVERVADRARRRSRPDRRGSSSSEPMAVPLVGAAAG